jgi:outer membrane lipoprotein-sorting protein
MNSLDRTLELFAAREPESALVDAAQEKLVARVTAKIAAQPARAPARNIRGWLTAAATAVVVAVAALWLPFGPAPVLAFEQVQRHFRDFHTMRFDMEQSMNGQPVMKARISVHRDGSVRTEVGDDVVVVVNSEKKQVLTLVKSAQMAVLSPINQAPTKEESLDWLDEIRKFQGAAKELPGTRTIRGERVSGWELELNGSKVVLWANGEGLPLEMTLDQGASIKMSFRFEFEPVLPADVFSTMIPAGFHLAEAEG